MTILQILTDLCSVRQSVKIKKHICKYCLQCFSSKKIFVEHKVVFLKINGRQTVRLRSDSIKCKNYFKKLAVPFKISVDFECIVKRLESFDKCGDRDDNALNTEKYQKHIPCSFAYKVACVDYEFSKPVVPNKGKNAVSKFIKAILDEYEYCKKGIKNILMKILLCLKKMSRYFNQVISAGYVISYLMWGIIK